MIGHPTFGIIHSRLNFSDCLFKTNYFMFPQHSLKSLEISASLCAMYLQLENSPSVS